ncbi:MAG: hypothetical protein ABL867_02100 [Rickettsiales bacterium]
MEIKQKKSILEHLARIADADQAAKEAVEKEADKIVQVLATETQYDVITAQIELLDTIAYRVFEKAVATCSALLKRLETIELTHQEIAGYPLERLQKFYTKEKIIIAVLEVLQHIRYHAPEAIMDLFFAYSVHSDETVRKQAITGIEAIASYDLDIFYGDGKGWVGLGWQPQEKVLEKIKAFAPEQQKKYLDGILAASKKMLSPTAEGTRWSYDKVTISTGAIPAQDGIKSLRNQVLDLLKSLYHQAESLEGKRRILGVMQVAAGTPHMGKYGNDILEMVAGNIVTILEFMKEIAPSEDMQMMQKIEHDAYWHYYRMGDADPRIQKVAFEIRDLLLAHDEYKIFRILIGFESIFREWKTTKQDHDEIEEERQYREKTSIELAQSITEEDYDAWKKRILHYASIKSNDMATFPYFGKFLEAFGRHSPDLALKLVRENVNELNGFIVALLCGAALTDKEKAYDVIRPWVAEGKQLFYVLRFFEFSDDLDEILLKQIFDKATVQKDSAAMNQIIATVSTKISDERKSLISAYFLPAIQWLTEQGDCRWIFNFWYRRERKAVIAAMPEEGITVILDNLFLLPRIDHEAEEVLCQLADTSPEAVLQFFLMRITKEKTDGLNNEFEAVPFSFYKLAEPLSKIPETAANVLREQYDGNYGMFIYRGAKLLKNIFPQFHDNLEKALVRIAHGNTRDDLLFVMAILRNYEGQPFIHGVCRELVKILPEDDELLGEVRIILQSTGVVHGTHGFAEAFARKIGEIEYWLNDADPKIKAFTEKYIQGLRLQIEAENKRADEDIILRRHQYGTDDDSE